MPAVVHGSPLPVHRNFLLAGDVGVNGSGNKRGGPLPTISLGGRILRVGRNARLRRLLRLGSFGKIGCFLVDLRGIDPLPGKAFG
jgi:hypothetical protein